MNPAPFGWDGLGCESKMRKMGSLEIRNLMQVNISGGRVITAATDVLRATSSFLQQRLRTCELHVVEAYKINLLNSSKLGLPNLVATRFKECLNNGIP